MERGQRPAPELPDWGQAELSAPAGGALRWIITAVYVVPPLMSLSGIPVGIPVVVVLAQIIAWVACVAWWLTSLGRRALAFAGAREPAPDELVRVRNLVSGLSSDLGIDPPTLFVAEGEGPNALVAKTSRYAIAVTAGLAESFSRTELEAVLAHCLVRIASGGVPAAQTGLALGRLGRHHRGWVGGPDDIAAAALTRYPPALAAAITKCEPRGGRLAPLWFVADDPSHVPASERAAVLLDL